MDGGLDGSDISMDGGLDGSDVCMDGGLDGSDVSIEGVPASCDSSMDGGHETGGVSTGAEFETCVIIQILNIITYQAVPNAFGINLAKILGMKEAINTQQNNSNSIKIGSGSENHCMIACIGVVYDTVHALSIAIVLY